MTTWNVMGIGQSTEEELDHILDQEDSDIIVLTETKYTSQNKRRRINKSFRTHKYHIYNSSKTNRSAGV